MLLRDFFFLSASKIPGVPYFIYFLNKIILYGFLWFLGGCVFLFVKL